MGNKKKQPVTTLDWALEYIKRGWKVLPCYRVEPDGDCACPPNSDERVSNKKNPGVCKTPGKHPVSRLVPRGSLDASDKMDQIEAWFSKDGQYNIAIATGDNRQGNLMVVDLDTRKGKDGPATWEALKKELGGDFPETLQQTTGSGGKQLFWWTDVEVPMSQETKLGSGIDVRGRSGYVVVPPSANDLGSYQWDNWPLVPESAPKALEERAIHGKPASPRPKVTARQGATDTEEKDDPKDKLTLSQVKELLNAIPADEFSEWMQFGHTIKTISDWIGGEEKAFEIWDEWAKTGDGYGGERHQQKKWASFKHPTLYPIGVLKSVARRFGWKPSDEFERESNSHWKRLAQEALAAIPKGAESDSSEVTALLGILSHLSPLIRNEYLAKLKERNRAWRIGDLRSMVEQYKKKRVSDDGEETDYGMIVARRVLASHFEGGQHLIYLNDGHFWRYNGRYWEQIVNDKELGHLCMEETLALGPLPKDVAVVVRQAIDNLSHLQARGGDPLRLMQPPPPVINCRNGELWILDDFSVERRDHNPESFLRFCLDIDYDPAAECPEFEEAVLKIFQASKDPADMQRHLLEVYGYAIQPRRFIKSFFIWQGGGDNGKGKLIEVLIELAGKQAVAPGRIVDLEREYYRANLVGKLIYYEDDIAHGTVLPDGALKQYSEAKYTSGRHAYGRIDEFVVCVLPIMLCNPWPITKDLTTGTQTRAHVIPFRHKFKDKVDKDVNLFDRIIKQELAGILNRAIEGLQRLMARGHFLEPVDCLEAKEEFLNASNPLPAFLNSGFCIRTLKEEIDDLTARFDGELALLRDDATRKKIENERAVAVAKAEDAGIKGISQNTQEFYTNMLLWSRNEGHRWMPKKAQVESDLDSLGFMVVKSNGQLRVYGLRSKTVPDQTPTRPM